MSYRVLSFAVAVLLSLTLHPDASTAQQTLPVPDKDSAALIKILESDSTTFEKAKACQQLAIVGRGDESAVLQLSLLLRDEQLSTYARSVLENMPGRLADEILGSACDSLKGNQLLGVIQSVGKRQNPESIPKLARLMYVNDQKISVAAARALGQIGTPNGADLLQQRMSEKTGDWQAELGKACLICAQRLIEQGETKSAELLCQNLMNSKLPEEIRLRAAHQKVLARGKNGRINLLRMFAAGDQGQFEMALYAAHQLDPDAKMSIEYASMLEKQEPGNQIQMLALLADQGDQRVLPSVLKLAKTDDVDVRVAAINAISRLGDESCVPVLLDACSSTEQPVVEAAIAAAASIKAEQMDDAAVKLLESKDERSVLSAIEIVAGRRIASAAEKLNGLLENEDEQIRKRAAYALGQVVTVDQFGRLVKLMIELDGNRLFADVQKALKSACLRMPRERCAQTLASFIEKAPRNSKIALMEQLAFVGGPNALKTIVLAAKSNDDAMQDAATRVLGEWLTADAAPEIYQLAKSYPKGKYRTRVLRGYIRIARQLSMTMDERMEVCRNALDMADRKEEKLLVLDVLRRHRSHEGLAIAGSLMNEPGLTGKAKATIQRIKDDIGDDPETGFVALFDGKTLDGWKGGDLSFWQVEDGAIMGGDLVNKVKRNEFLRTTKQYGDFELRLQFKLTGKKTNAGVQIRTAEIPDHHEVSGYQADLGDGWWGCLYDESRRRKMLAGPPADERAKPVRMGQWNDYRILCEGKRIQLWINGTKTVDYTEKDPEIPQTGIIALQVHGNLTMEARYRNIRIKELR